MVSQDNKKMRRAHYHFVSRWVKWIDVSQTIRNRFSQDVSEMNATLDYYSKLAVRKYTLLVQEENFVVTDVEPTIERHLAALWLSFSSLAQFAENDKFAQDKLEEYRRMLRRLSTMPLCIQHEVDQQTSVHVGCRTSTNWMENVKSWFDDHWQKRAGEMPGLVSTGGDTDDETGLVSANSDSPPSLSEDSGDYNEDTDICDGWREEWEGASGPIELRDKPNAIGMECDSENSSSLQKWIISEFESSDSQVCSCGMNMQQGIREFPNGNSRGKGGN